ncbi:MAG: hypothetical protein KKD44_17475 [Proteobacteria bacterium]|nr:hypothetical protein [Pseudomonadota bacterium]
MKDMKFGVELFSFLSTTRSLRSLKDTKSTKKSKDYASGGPAGGQTFEKFDKQFFLAANDANFR